MSRLIHLNGPPAVGKSTLARRWVDEHPGALLCDIDVLRTMIGGWQDDFHRAGELIRTTALAMISSYLAEGNDVVLPQLVTRADELARFRRAAESARADYVGVVLEGPAAEVIGRFRDRAERNDRDPWTGAVVRVVDGLGGDDALRRSCADLDALAEAEGLLRVWVTDPDSTYDALVAAVGG